MKAEDFLVTTSLGKRSRKLVWNPEDGLVLDPEQHWILERTEKGVQLRDSSVQGNTIPISEETIGGKKTIEVPPAHRALNKNQRLRLQLVRLNRISAPFLQPPPDPKQRACQTFLFQGVHNFIISYRPAGGSYTGTVDTKRIFSYRKTAEGFLIKAAIDGVTIRTSKTQRKTLDGGETTLVSVQEMGSAKMTWGKYWWRFNQIPLAPPLPENQFFEDEEALDKQRYFKTLRTIGAVMGAFCVTMLLVPRSKDLDQKQVPTTVQLKAPKIIAPSEFPKVELKQPKIEPEKKEPVKVAAPAKPKLAKPEPVPKAETVAKNLPSAPPKVAAPRQPSAQELKTRAEAETRAQITKSLSFLSSNPKVTAKTDSYANQDSKYKDTPSTVTKGMKQGSNYLGKVSNSGIVSDGPIQTKGARDVQAGTLVAEGETGLGQKSLNHVQGKVSLNNLYDYGPGGDADGEVGGALSKGGIAMSGSGQLAESAIVAALSKRLAKFQYCYEKALLTDPSLSGNIMMEWQIAESGAASQIKVVRSQMNNASLQKCIANEISKIQFPQPKGGSVLIKYPFNFSSSSL